MKKHTDLAIAGGWVDNQSMDLRIRGNDGY